ncbi:alpha/beta hydrolase [Flagellimonas aequoris]|uniref:Alpha/beta hydrolase n=1 Tax=Flagellimonas aequoris TaxID=2306997 RepID=A0A418NBN4_9FLAO|nr:alpha/beta hydrolase [Allomuricauda aequoris]TXK07672.1 alpha/beta hydrolase [Allomuricauda aequoris]
MPLFFLLLFSSLFVVGQEGETIELGHSISLHSKILNEDRSILFSLPDSYNDPSKTDQLYPIIILLDGYVHFKTASAIVHFMGSRTNRSYLMPETIVVAIENVDRERDFTITKLQTKRANTMGGGKKFLDFIEKELIPYVDNHYRAAPHRTLIGHSLGGLLTVNAYLDPHSLFDAYLAIDPSIWWDETTMESRMASMNPTSIDKKLYWATANQGEANYERNKKRHDRFVAMMEERWRDKLQVKQDYFEEEDHRSVPLPALYEGLKYLNETHK